MVVSFVDQTCDWHYALVYVIINVISYNIDLRFTGTHL